MSARAPQFPWTLGPTGCSDVGVLELRHPHSPLSHFVSHVNIVRSSCRHVWRFRPRPWYLNSPTEPNSFSFNSLTGGPGLLSLVTRPFQGAPTRLKFVDGLSSGAHVRKTNAMECVLEPDGLCSEDPSISPRPGSSGPSARRSTQWSCVRPQPPESTRKQQRSSLSQT